MKRINLMLISLTVICSCSYAQNVRFTRSGIIEYQKTVNMYAIIERGINKDNEGLLKPAFETYKQEHLQFKELKSSLKFRDHETLFTPEGTNTATSSFFNDPLISMQNNIVYSDLSTRQLVSKKKVFGDTYLLKDSIRSIKWKFTDEIRDVAGYPCHRANGLILDSVYVVAFYTDEIPVSGGPESFGGLPGMILQVALPHENVSWMATKIEDIELSMDAIQPPNGGTLINYKELMAKLRTALGADFQRQVGDLKAILL